MDSFKPITCTHVKHETAFVFPNILRLVHQPFELIQLHRLVQLYTELFTSLCIHQIALRINDVTLAQNNRMSDKLSTTHAITASARQTTVVQYSRGNIKH